MSDGWRDEDRGDPEVIHAAVRCPPRAVTDPAREPLGLSGAVLMAWPGVMCLVCFGGQIAEGSFLETVTTVCF